MHKLNRIIAAVITLIIPVSAHAYIGPGIGVGAIGLVIAFFGSILLGVFAVLYYPIKRALRKRKQRTAAGAAKVSDDKHEEAGHQDAG